MPRVIQRSFAGGEVSPDLYGRADTVKFKTGLKTCRNFKVRRYGGVDNRAGTEFVAEVKDSTRATRLLKFVFNGTQTYVLEFGHLYMRVIRFGVQLTDLTLTITNITQANPAAVTYTGTDPANGQEVYISGVAGMTLLNTRNFKIANVNAGANTFELQYMDGTNVDSTAFAAYVSGGTAERVYEIATPYDEADLRALHFVQSGDTVTIVHPSYAPRDLVRTGHTSWSLSAVSFAPSIAAPTGESATPGTGGGLVYRYKITAVAEESYEESLPSGIASCNCAAPTQTAPNVITWNVVSGAAEYYVYRETYIGSGVYAYLGTAASNAFNDPGITPDNSATPPGARDPFPGASDYPSEVTYFQQRRVFANTDNNPEKVWTSRSGQFTNFTTSSPLQDDDAVTFTIAGRQVNEVRHMLDLGGLVLLTSGAEWTVQGDADGVLRPTAINLRPEGYHGAAELAPVLIGNTAIYLQARGAVVRDLAYRYENRGYTGKELSIYAPHLFDGYQIVSWDYQEITDSVVWAVRDDGVLLGLTYLPDQEVWGWHRHDTFQGWFEDVLSVPEGDEDALYFIVTRGTKQYIERLHTRRVAMIEEAFFVDSGLTYDGRNVDAGHTMTLSGGVDWTYLEDLTLTSSASYFSTGEVGNAIVLEAEVADETVSVECTIIGYTSPTEVTVQANKDVPVEFQGVAINLWSRAAESFTGLWHLEGSTLSVLADGNVEDPVVVTNGSISLPRPYSIVHAGLPITADFETLDIDAEESAEIRARKKRIPSVDLLVAASRGIWAGPDADNLREYKQRNQEPWGAPTEMYTGLVEISLQSTWKKSSRVFVRQQDPLPLGILSIIPYGELGG